MGRQAIVVFERHTDTGKPELDWRPVRAALPSGSSPLAMADRDGFSVHYGQDFLPESVIELAESVSGYKSAATVDGIGGFSYIQYP